MCSLNVYIYNWRAPVKRTIKRFSTKIQKNVTECSARCSVNFAVYYAVKIWCLGAYQPRKNTKDKHTSFRGIIPHSFHLTLDIVLFTGLRGSGQKPSFKPSKPSQKLTLSLFELKIFLMRLFLSGVFKTIRITLVSFKCHFLKISWKHFIVLFDRSPSIR